MSYRKQRFYGVLIGFMLGTFEGCSSPASAQDAQERGPRQRQDKPACSGTDKRDLALTSMPDPVRALAALSVLLGRPTDTRVTANVGSVQAQEAYIEFGLQPGIYTAQIATKQIAPEESIEVLLDHLQPNTRWYYRLRYRSSGQTEFAAAAPQSFHTQRTPGSSFVFEFQGDSHPERPQQFDAGLYAQTALRLLVSPRKRAAG